MPSGGASAESGGSRKRALVVGSGLNATSQVMLLVINLALTPYVIIGFGPERFSIYLLISSISVLMSTMDGGIGAAAQRFFTLYAGAGDVQSRSRMLASLVGITMATTLAIFPVIIAVAPGVVDFFRVEEQYADEAIFLLRSLIALTGLLIIRNLFSSLLYAHRRFGVTAGAAMASHLIFAGGMIASVELGWGLYGVAVTLVSVQLFVSLVIVPFALRLVQRRYFRWFAPGVFGDFMGYAWKLQLSSVLVLVTGQKDQLVAGRLLGAQSSGPYGQGANLAAQLSRLPLNALSPMQSVIGQDVGRFGEEGSLRRTETLQRVWVRLSTVWLAIGVPSIYVGVRAWLPESFALTATVASLLMIGLFFQLCTTVLRLWCLTVGRPGLELEMLAISLTVNVLLSVVFYHGLGMLGVVAATAVSYGVGALHLQRRASHVLTQPLRSFVRDIPPVSLVILFALTALIQFLAAPYLPNGLLGFLSAGLLALPSVAVAVFLLVPRRERGFIVERLRRGRRQG